MSVGIREVAAHAKTSTASVSRALSNPASVRPELRARIEAAIRKLGYVPSAAARALSSGRTRTIGAIIPTIDNAMFARGIQALQEFLALHDYQLLLTTNAYDLELEYRQAQNLIRSGIEGLLLRGAVHTDKLRELLDLHRLPFVNVGVYHPDEPHACVGTDNEGAAYRSARYLIELGHRHLGMIAAHTHHNDRALGRVAGVRRALSESALELPEAWYFEVKYTLDDAREAARRLLSLRSYPTAVVCGNDVIAWGVLLEAQRLGVKVPKQLSVVGFDDLDMSRHLHPSLTTVRVPTNETWSRAGEYLVRKLAGESPPLHHEIDASLVVRESTAPPGRTVHLPI